MTENKKRTAAVIVAAGSSLRMGNDIKKQFLKVKGVPVLLRTLQSFEVCDRIDEIVVVAGGSIAHRGTTEEIFPLILANTLGGCPVLSKEEKK